MNGFYNPIVPYSGFTISTPTLPNFYWNVYSSEQRFKHMCKELHKIVEYANMLGININLTHKKIEELEKHFDKVLEETKLENELTLKRYRDEMIDLIESIEKGNLQYDVTTGKYVKSIDAMRNMFNDVTVHAFNNAELEELYEQRHYTVDQLANCGLNVKGYANVNQYIKSPRLIDFELGDCKYGQE